MALVLCSVAFFAQHRDFFTAQTVASGEVVGIVDAQGSAESEARIENGRERLGEEGAKWTMAAFHYRLPETDSPCKTFR